MSYKRISPVPVTEGGTGDLSTTPYAVVCGGTSSTSAFQPIASLGTAGQILTSNGAGALPSFQAAPIGTIDSLTGNTGGAISPSAGNINVIGDGTTITIAGSGNTLTASLIGTGAIQTLTGSTSGGAISPLAGNINITAGTGITVVGTAHTLTISSTGVGAAITSITGNTGGAQTGPAITFTGGTTGLSFGGSANTITTTFAGITANGGTVSLATDATTSTINIGTGAGAKTTTLGSTNTTSTTTLNSGSGGINLTNTNQPITITSGTGTISIATDATANTVNIATGAGVKTVAVGSTNTTSGLTLNSGSTGITATGVYGATSSSSIPLFINSSGKLGTSGGSGGSTFVQTLTGSTGGGAIPPTAGNINLTAGTGISIVGAGSSLTITNTGGGGASSVAFFAYLNTTKSNVTGNGVFYPIAYDTKLYDVGSNFSTGTSLFTAPVTGKYNFSVGVSYGTLTSTNADGGFTYLVVSGIDYLLSSGNYSAARTTTGGPVVNQTTIIGSGFISMTAGDTAAISTQCNGGTQTVSILGVTTWGTGVYATFFSGVLAS